MDQYTNYFDALSQSMYSQQADAASTFLSPVSHPPSLSASPVSSEGSDSFIDEAIRYGLFAYDNSSAMAYNPYNQNSANNFVAGPTPINDPSSPSTVVKHEDSFGYDHNMALDRGIDPSMSTYQPMTGYAPQERNPLAFDYPVHPNTVSSLANMLTGSAPFATVAPSATSGLPDEDASAYNLSAEIAELSISSPASSTIFHAGSLSSSSSLIPIFQPQTPVCDPKTLDSPVIMEQTTMEAGPSNQPEGSRRSRTSFYRASTADSDYAPSGESEVDDKNDGSYGKPLTRKKARSARVAHAAHPYLKPAPKAKGNARRGTKLELPVPVPGLTKNSRGRTVPKKTESTFEDVSRPFWCHVEDCDKLFSRGEHLKRHISSIHTDDKPFKCECENKFSRRDNLFQHMRAKGCVVWYKNGVKQCEVKDEMEDEIEMSKAMEEAEDHYIQQIMADAAIAQKKRDRAAKQARSRF